MAEKTYTLTDLDRNWVKFGLNRTKESLLRQLEAQKTTETVKEAVRKDLRMLESTYAKFDG